jgi:hypothetical protein
MNVALKIPIEKTIYEEYFTIRKLRCPLGVCIIQDRLRVWLLTTGNLIVAMTLLVTLYALTRDYKKYKPVQKKRKT